MSESVKSVCALVFAVALIGGILAWLLDQPGPTMWAFRVGCPVVAVGALGVILGLQGRKDLAPDYLHGQVGGYFNRDGFCFGFRAVAKSELCVLEAYYQNQMDQASVGRIALRPAKGFWLGRAPIENVTFEIACDPGAFGVVRMPLPVPEKLQGKTQAFEVGASVKYPSGKGRKVRFRDGIFLRANSKFGNKFGTALTVAGAAGGMIVLSSPATVKLKLPEDVVETLPDDLPPPKVKTLWKLGDAPLEG